MREPSYGDGRTESARAPGRKGQPNRDCHAFAMKLRRHAPPEKRHASPVPGWVGVRDGVEEGPWPRPSAAELRRDFLLDPEVAFLNHGSFGACPRPVFERYQAWQRELEREPVDFLDRRLPGLLATRARPSPATSAAAPDDLAFVQNATTGVNLAARSLDLRPGDEVLTTDLEYGACDLAWDWVCRRTGARYVRAPIPLPLSDPSEVVEALFAAVTASAPASSTSATSPPRPRSSSRWRRSSPARESWASSRSSTAPTRPRRCRVDLDAARRRLLQRQLSQMALRPKGAASSTSGPSTRSGSTPQSSAGATPRARTSPSGSRRRGRATPPPGSPCPTRSASRPSATGTPSRDRCRELAREARAELCELLGTEPLAPDAMLAQMATVRLPRPAPDLSRQALRARTASRSRVAGAENDLLRLSVAAYTTRDDIDRS